MLLVMQNRKIDRPPARTTISNLVPENAPSLGSFHFVVQGSFLISVLVTSFSALGELPVTILRPIGVMKLLPWSFYDDLLTPTGMSLLKWAVALSLVLSTGGFLPSLTTKTPFLLIVFYQHLL